MTELNLPKYNFKIKQSSTKPQIFDEIRKKYIILTPEEWVRQNFVQYLVQELNYPKGLITIEKSLTVNGMTRRTDIVVYKEVEPVLIVECKAANVKINQAVFNQITAYNLTLKVPYLIVTNGLIHYIAKIDFKEKKHSFMGEIPSFDSY